MNILLIYMVKVAVYLTAFYLVYSLMLSRDTAYGRNRAFILISLVSAIVFPLITFQTVKPMDIQFFGKFLSEVFITASPEGLGNQASGFTLPGTIQIIYTIYIIGVVAFLFKLIIDLLNLAFLILRERSSGSRIIRFHGFNTAGFSAMGYVFVNARLSPEEAGEIIRHEQNHLKQNHFLDIIFMETVMAFQWFNPVIYLINRALRAVHEFQADHECISSGVPVVSYQSLLLSQVFKSRAFNLTNSFSNPSLIKRRMIMMTKKPTSALANMKLLLVLPVIAIVFLAISAYKEIPENELLKQTDNESFVLTSSLPVAESQSASLSEPAKTSVKETNASSSAKVIKQIISQENIAPPPPPPPPPADKEKVNEDPKKEAEEAAEVPFVVVEEMPMFPGGDVNLLKFIGENTNYPQAAKESNIQGRVIVRFCVTAKGGVSQASILKGVSPELDEEALRVVSTLPTFEPGKQGGKPVPVWYMVPITFTLK
ncbi:MAG: TonB family protein [Bacteroidales bacterium]|nr:TonB family protein [Bacteroidales bacterium]